MTLAALIFGPQESLCLVRLITSQHSATQLEREIERGTRECLPGLKRQDRCTWAVDKQAGHTNALLMNERQMGVYLV